VLELERGKRSVLAAAEPAEGDDGARVAQAGEQRRDLGGEIEILRLDPDLEPPVIGGKSAISRAPATGSSWRECSWLMATRMASGWRSAS
jgi:hypothetical protein